MSEGGYNFSRRLPKGKTLPHYAVEHFNQLVAQYLTLSAEKTTENCQAKAFAEALIRQQEKESQQPGFWERIWGRKGQRAEERLNWGDLCGMEMCVLRLAPAACLRHLGCSLNARYHDLTGQDWYDAPQLHPCPNTAKTIAAKEAEEEDLRGNLAMMLAEVQRRRSLILARESQRNLITWFGATGAILTVIGGLALGHTSLSHPANQTFLRICFVMLGGATGGWISMLRRLQSAGRGTDQSRDIIVMEAGQTSLLLSPLYGAIFASILYLIFKADMLSTLLGGKGAVGISCLFPVFTPEGLLAKQEVAKLMVWSFVAGFAEKFVPDVLDRIASRSQTKSGKPFGSPV